MIHVPVKVERSLNSAVHAKSSETLASLNRVTPHTETALRHRIKLPLAPFLESVLFVRITLFRQRRGFH